MQFRAVKGMNDLLPKEIRRWHQIEQTFRNVAELHGYAEIRTPILEATELFVRSIGEATDVVEKQMFTLDRNGESLAMRPEGTAGATRAYVTHSLHAQEPVTRWYYMGPMFRAEQPQRGRYRQFYQIGCEIYGDQGPVCDAELIEMLYSFLSELGLTELTIAVNSIGGPATRQRYRQALLEYLKPKAAELSEHARKRLEDNPLRILDSKDPRDQAAVADAPSVLDQLEPDDQAHWDLLRRSLDTLGTPYTVAPRLIRGLDYYSRTLFEFSSKQGELGAQNTLLGGGRYDGLVHTLGGPHVPAIGFAMGLERLILALGAQEPEKSQCIFVAPLGQAATLEALTIGRELRARGLQTEVDGRGGSLKSMLRRADALHARFCLIMGDTELQKGTVLLKDLASHTQEEIPRAGVSEQVSRLLSLAVPPSIGTSL